MVAIRPHHVAKRYLALLEVKDVLAGGLFSLLAHTRARCENDHDRGLRRGVPFGCMDVMTLIAVDVSVVEEQEGPGERTTFLEKSTEDLSVSIRKSRRSLRKSTSAYQEPLRGGYAL